MIDPVSGQISPSGAPPAVSNAPSPASPSTSPEKSETAPVDGAPIKRGPGRPRLGEAAQTEEEKKAKRRIYDAARKAQQRAMLSRVTPNPNPPQQQTPITAQLPIAQDYQAFGKECAFLFIMGGTLVFGDAWKPENEGEQKSLEGAFEGWARYHSIGKLSPDLTLILACSMYGASRMKHDTVRSRFSRGWQWLKSKTTLRRAS